MNELTAGDGGLHAATSYAAPIELIARCLEGEESAFATVYNLYAEMIYRLCYSLLGHKEDAEEVMQDTFEYAFRILHRYDSRRAGFKTWLYQIAISRCRNKRRRKWLPTLPIARLPDSDLKDRQAITPDDALDLSERQLAVWEAIMGLSDKQREVAVLRYYQGLTYREIGAILSIPAKTAESRMRLAHGHLKRCLIDQELRTE